ncbi:BglG family transcription antiterminator [Bacillus sp. AFS055030]|uniref:BglG family transcription antiterminator n=1 Tax=Bacillus sp. AFS055030 TaxID=2033507 RepID=UPI000BFBF8F5|nr:BglG family transcription antiterminator [Bacillus sp. AFS055030]PGL72597.1 hypothetical protein CN925_04385 [Bacillus sp. AFS055030]
MFSYNRLNKIFTLLFTKSFVPQSELAELFNVSSRTIRNDINELNEELKKYHGQIILVRGQGYSLQRKEILSEIHNRITTESHHAYNHLETSEERIKELLTLLLFSEDYLSLDELCDTLFVGRTTLLGYMRQIKGLLKKYNLTIKAKTNIGYKIFGDEKNIRSCISEQLINKNSTNYITSFTPSEQKLFKNLELDEIAQVTMKFFPPDIFLISDFHRKNFIIHLAISITRMQNDCALTENIPPTILMDMNFQDAMEQLINYLEERFHLTFPLGERRWIYLHFISNIPQNIFTDEVIEEIEVLVEQIVDNIFQIFDVDLRNDPVLKKDLFQHFSTYLPVKEILKEKNNPLLDTIKQAYPYAFQLTLLAMEKTHVFHKYNLNEDEIGYVALHIASSLERNKETIVKKKKILLVCGQGTSTSRLVETILYKEFRDRVEIIDTVSYAVFQLKGEQQADFIVSTIPISNAKVPVVEVDFLSLKKGIEVIKKMLSNDNRSSELIKFFDSSLFFVGNKKIKQSECLKYLSQELENKGFVSNQFYQKVMQREKLSPTNITSSIAIPHAMVENITESKIAVYISEEPIQWSEGNYVNIVFLLAIAESDKKGFELFFEKLYEVMSYPKVEKKIMSAKTFEEFLFQFA